MSEKPEDLKVDSDRYVNEATLELLRRRIESEVRSNFLKTVTIPIGGTGIVAIVLAVLFWIPQQVRSFLDNPAAQQTVETEINKHITAYFQREDTQEQIAEKIQRQTTSQIARELESQLPAKVNAAVEAQVKQYFDTEEGRKLVQNLLPSTVEAYFKRPASQAKVQDLVQGYLDTQGKELIVTKLDEILQPAAERISGVIDDNLKRYVSEFEPQSLHGEPKESLPKLDAYVRPDNVRRLKELGQPIVLTKTIADGNSYVASVIENYLDRFGKAFGDQFQYVAISYAGRESGTGKLVALVPIREFDLALKRDARSIEQLINYGANNPPLSEKMVQARLASLFGDAVTRTIPSHQPIGRVLKDPRIWEPASLVRHESVEGGREITSEPVFVDPDQYEFAVVDANGSLLARTSRAQLLAGLLRPAQP